MAKLSFEATNATEPVPFNGSEPNKAVWVQKERYRKENLSQEFRIAAIKSVRYQGNTMDADTTRIFYKIVVKAPVVKKLRKLAKAAKENVKADTLRSIKKRF